MAQDENAHPNDGFPINQKPESSPRKPQSPAPMQGLQGIKKTLWTAGILAGVSVTFLSLQNFTYYDATTAKVLDPTTIQCSPNGGPADASLPKVKLTDVNGNPLGEYDTIQAAIDAAPAGTPVKIQIPPRLFHENVTIPSSKPGISLIGEPGSGIDSVLIDGASDTVVQGLQLTGPTGRAALTILGGASGPANGIQILNNNITSGTPFSGACVSVSGKISDIKITGNRIHDCAEHGILLGGPTPARQNPDVIKGIISDNQIAFAGSDGVKVDGSADLDLNNNVISGSGRNRDGGVAASNGFGINVTSKGAPVVRTCSNRTYRNHGRLNRNTPSSTNDIARYDLIQPTCPGETTNGTEGNGFSKVARKSPIPISLGCSVTAPIAESVLPCPVKIDSKDPLTAVVYRNGQLLMSASVSELANLPLLAGNNDFVISVSDMSGSSGQYKFRAVHTPPPLGLPGGDLPPKTVEAGGVARSDVIKIPDPANGAGGFSAKPTYKASVAGDPGAVLIVNGIPRGQSADVRPGDTVQIEVDGSPGGGMKTVKYSIGGAGGNFVVKTNAPYIPAAGSPGAIDPIPLFDGGDGPGFIDPRTLTPGSGGGGGDEKCLSNKGELFRLGRNDPNHYCRFVGQKCPADWKYMGYNTTQGKRCETNLTYGTNGIPQLQPQYNEGIRTCDVGGHGFGGPNIPTESCQLQVCAGPYVNITDQYLSWGYCNAIGIVERPCLADVIIVGCQYIGQ